MHLLKYCFGIAPLLYTLFCFGQDDYSPIKSNGPIPKEFITPSSEKYQKEKATLGNKKSESDDLYFSKSDKVDRTDQNAKDEFYLKSNFSIDNILRSGQVVFNDSITNYLNKVKDELLKNDPKLKSEVRIYLTKSPAVNAFATNSGIILINVGLIAQLETEAQLAYILSHELVHYIHKHAITEYVENTQIDRGQGEYQGMSNYDKTLASCKYSQDLELEADLEGFELFNKSSFGTKSILNVFYVLQYSYLPFDDVPFDKTFFNTPSMYYPSKFFLEKVQEIKGDSTYDDSKSTHPNTQKRLEAVYAKMPVGVDTRSDFIVSKEEFFRCREKARMEIARLLVLNKRYEEAIYHSYLLLQQHPDSKYLKKIIAKSLYGLSKYKSDDRFYKVHKDHTKIEGESQQVYFFMNYHSSAELSALATSYLWNLSKKYPEDNELKLMKNDLLNTMVRLHYPELAFFSKVPFDTAQVQPPVDSSASVVDTTSKYAKIKKRLKVEAAQSTEYEYVRYAFVELIGDGEFVTAFQKVADAVKKEKSISDSEASLLKDQREKAKRRIEKKGYRLGTDRVVVVDPFYARINRRKRTSYRYEDTEKKKQNLEKTIQDCAQSVGVRADILSPLSFNESEVDKMNDFALVEEWIDERLDKDDLDTATLISPIHDEVGLLQNKYGTSKFCWSGSVWYTEKKDSRQLAMSVVICIVMYPLMPVAIYQIVKSNHRTLHYTLVYDITTGKESMHYVKYVKSKDNPNTSSASIYYTFLQIKTPQKGNR